MDVIDKKLKQAKSGLGLSNLKKRVRAEDQNDPPNVTHAATNQSDADAIFWRNKFEILRKEKTASNEDFEEALDNAIKRENESSKYVSMLEKKIALLSSSSSSSGGSSSSAVNLNEMNEKVESQRKLLAFYELMTSMSVKINSGTEFICTVKNKVSRKATRFSIDEDKTPSSSSKAGEPQSGSSQFMFAPLANIEMLPDYLNSRINFEPRVAPVLLGDVLQKLFENEEES